MPSTDAGAKSWQLELSARVGKAIHNRRKALGLTAQQLARRTAGLGYPVSRVAISKIESNVRAGKFDVAEWLVLAQALEIPPALLLFPDYPDGPVQALPGIERQSIDAVRWISGREGRGKTSGNDLVQLVEHRTEVGWDLGTARATLKAAMIKSPLGDDDEKALKQRIRMTEGQLEILDADIRRVKGELWGEGHE